MPDLSAPRRRLFQADGFELSRFRQDDEIVAGKQECKRHDEQGYNDDEHNTFILSSYLLNSYFNYWSSFAMYPLLFIFSP
jgi:hypothetical protein